MTGALNQIYHLTTPSFIRNQETEEFDRIVDELAAGIYSGDFTGRVVHQGLYNETADRLINAILGGFASETGYDSPRNGMRDFLQNNIFAFSAAKTLTEFEEFGRLLTDEDGNLKSRAQFRREVEAAGFLFNDRYLGVERETAISQAQMAEKWQDFEENRDVAAQWEYRTAGDAEVRPEHAALDGFILDLTDPNTDKLFPPLDFGCRCTAVQIDAPSRLTPQREIIAGIRQANINGYFTHNPGKSWIVYEDGHPYFKQMPKQLKAVENYNLKDATRIYRDRDKLPGTLYGVDTPADFATYWRDLCLNTGSIDKNEFYLDSPVLNHLKVTFDNELFKKYGEARKYLNEGRFKLIHNVSDTIAAPDEVWTAYKNQKRGKAELLTTYVKYYQDKPFIFITKTVKGEGKIRATSFYQVEPSQLAEYRQGILRYKK